MTSQTPAHAALPTIVNPPGLHDPTPIGYSTAVVAPAGARLPFISGQGGQDATDAFSHDFSAQVEQAYANLRAALAGLGAGPAHVVKLTVFVVDHDMGKLGVLTDAVSQTFDDHLPAQTLMPVAKLAIDTMPFEVEAVVGVSSGGSGQGGRVRVRPSEPPS